MKYLFEFAQYSEQPARTASFGVLGDLGKKSKFGEQTGYFKSLMEQAQAEGMITIYQAGIEKIKLGLTSIEEINRIMVD